MKAVYVCRGGANEELRYSLRSVERNLPCVDDVVIYGGKPRWCVAKLVTQTVGATKYAKAYHNLRLACMDESMDDSFVLMNDDFYVMEPTERVEYAHRGSLLKLVEWYESEHPKAVYTANTRRTYDFLVGIGIKDPVSYELHIPMVFEKDKLLEVLDMISGDMGLQYRTIYGNLCDVGGEYTEDVKVYAKGDEIPEGRYLSSWDPAFETVRRHLHGVFPEPSIWESCGGRSYLLSKDVVFDGRVYPAHSRISHETAVRMNRAGILKVKFV